MTVDDNAGPDRLRRLLQTPGPTRKQQFVYRIARDLVVGFSRLYFRASYEGLERVPTTGAFILSPVHRSNVDTLVAAGVTKRRLRFLGKEAMWKYRLPGRLFDALGGICVHRGTTDRESMRLCIEALEGGEPVVVYPEGTRREGPIVAEMFEGAAYMATKLGIPIVPVGIGGSHRAMGRGHRFPRPKKIAIIVGEPLQPTRAAAGERVGRRPTRELHDRLKLELQRLYNEAQQRAGSPNP